jgi:predicted nucleotidyltransferase
MATAIDPKSVNRAALAAFAIRHGVRFLALFGSAARGDSKTTSDVDVMMDLAANSQAGLFEQVRMASELEALFGRRVDLVTRASLKPRVRMTVEREAIVLYEA